jgi:glycosyltransferase involved in cell wall biosynthesis
VYPPEPVVSAQMGRDLAQHLTQDGARVCVLCPFPSRPIGAEYVDFRPSGTARVGHEDGVEVVRLPSFRAPQSRLVARMGESWSFGRHVCRYLTTQVGDLDVVYANAWPLFSQALIAWHCAQKGVPLVLHIKDIYPESVLGRLPGFCRGLAASPLTALDRWIARRAARVVVLSESTRGTYVNHRGLAPEKVITILDWVDESRFATLPARAAACARYGIPEERFTFLYLGNIGPVAGVEMLIEAFHAADLKQAQLVIAGDGSCKAACVKRAKSLGVGEARFISDPEANNVPLLQSLGDVCLLPMRKGAGMSSIPSKLLAYLLSGKPVLATVDPESDTAKAISEAQCGWIREPENVQGLAEQMRGVAGLTGAELDRIGQRGRSYGLAHYSKAAGVCKLANVIVQAARHVEIARPPYAYPGK